MSTDPQAPKNPTDPFGGAENTGFDYAAFEESLAQAEPADEEMTDPGQVEVAVERRPTLDLARIPQDDATYDLRELGRYTVVTIRGRINESFAGEELGQKLKGAVVFDLTEVDRITSFGVRSWLQMLDVAKLKEGTFVRASPAVINQVTMMRNFCGPARIHSLVAPYACEHCGTDFGVTYDAVEDRNALRARNPLLIECPSCRNAAELDEDPWVFFGIDDQLLDEVSPELSRVLANMGDRPNHAPIEKAIVGDTTRVRFNGVVDGSTRFQRAFTGLEGTIVVDLRTASQVDGQGVDGLFQQLHQLDAGIRTAYIEGCPLALLERLLDEPNPRLEVRSAQTTVHAKGKDLSRLVVVDLAQHRIPLAEGRVPVLEVPWQNETLELDGLPILKRAVLAHRSVPPAADRRAPEAVPAAAARAAVPAVAIAGVLGVLVLGGIIGAALLWGPGATTPVAAPTPVLTAPVPFPPTAEGEWSSGGLLPPSWSERPLTADGSRLLVSGIGKGASPTDALEAARQVSLVSLLPEVRKRLITLHATDALPEAGSPAYADALTHWDKNAALIGMERVEQASRRTSDGQHEVAVQYAVDTSKLDSTFNDAKRTVSFRGIDLAQRPPWTDDGIRVTNKASFVTGVQPGDLLVAVNQTPVVEVGAFETLANRTFDGLANGGSITLMFDREGTQVPFVVQKRQRATDTPVPTPRQNVPTLQMPGQ